MRLDGRVVIITRPAPSDAALAQVLRAAGAAVRSMPALRVVLDGDGQNARAARGAVTGVDAVLLTSRNGLLGLLGPLSGVPADWPMMAAVGASTARCADELGGRVLMHVVTGGAAALIDRLLREHAAPAARRYLWPHGNLADETPFRRLTAAGAHVERYEVYDSAAGYPQPHRADALEGVDSVVFASPSAAAAFTAAIPDSLRTGLLDRLTVATVGPTTAAAARRLGWRRVVVGARPDGAALVDALAHSD